MSPSDVTQFARRWWWLLLLGAFLAAFATYVVSEQLPRVYEARATLLVGSSAGDELSSNLTSDLLTATYAELITTRPILATVAAASGTSVEDLDAAIDASALRNTHFIQLRFRSNDPKQAADLANLVATTAAQQLQAARVQRAGERIERVRGVIDQVAQEVADRQAQVRTLQGQSPAPQRDVQLTVALADLSRTQLRYQTALSALDDARVAQVGAGDVLTVTEPAEVPASPILPRVAVNVFSAAVVGLLIAVLIGLLLDALLDRTESAPELADAAGALSFGSVPVLAPPVLERGMEAFRSLRTTLRSRVGEPPYGAVLVTAIDAGAGCTTVAAGLGEAFARAGDRVVLVDANVRQPRLAELYTLSAPGGLTTLLADHDLRATSLIRETRIERLSVLPVGVPSSNAPDALASERMARVVRELSETFDLVIVDAPSLDVSDPLELVAAVRNVVLVVESGSSGPRSVARSAERLTVAGGRLVTLVINRVRPRTAVDLRWRGSDLASAAPRA